MAASGRRGRRGGGGGRPKRSPEDLKAFRPLLLLAVTVFIDLLGFGLVLPNMPRYIEMTVGADHSHAALIGTLLGASYSFTQFLCAPFWGRYSDRAGRRPVILISLIGIAASYLLFGFAGDRLWMLFVARLLAGVLSSASIGVAFAYVADVTTPEKRAQGIGLLGACFGLGFTFGPAFGGLLGAQIIALPAFVAAGIALVNFLFTYRYLPESLTKEARDAARHGETATGTGSAYSGGITPRLLRDVILSPAGFLFLLTFLVTFGFSALEQTFSFYLLSVPTFGVTQLSQPRWSGTILGLSGFVGIIIQGGLIGRLTPRFGEAKLVRTGMFLMAVGFALFALPRELWAFIVGPMLLLAIGRSLTAPALSSLTSRKTTFGQGLTLSVSQSFDALARTVGPLTAGALFYNIRPSAPFELSACVLAIALLVTLIKARDMIIPPPAAASPTDPVGGTGVEAPAPA